MNKSKRMKQKQSNGIAWLLMEDLLMLKTTSTNAMLMAQAWPKTLSKRYDGITWLLVKEMHKLNITLVYAMSMVLESRRMQRKLWDGIVVLLIKLIQLYPCSESTQSKRRRDYRERWSRMVLVLTSLFCLVLSSSFVRSLKNSSKFDTYFTCTYTKY